LTRPTTTERQIASRIAATSDERIHPQDAHDLSKLDLPRTSLSNRHLIIHYKHEARLCIYKKDIHQLWDHIFETTTVTDTKLIVGNSNSPNMNKMIVHRRPDYRSTAQQNAKPNHNKIKSINHS
jgi:hypothetical protein